MTFSVCSELVATTRSTNLEATLEFDIGRYELASSASNVGFLSRGKTGRTKDLLTSSTSTGSKLESGVVTNCVLIICGGVLFDARIFSTFEHRFDI